MLARIVDKELALRDAGRAKCIRLDNVRACFKKPPMNVANQLRPRQRKQVSVVQQVLFRVRKALPANVRFFHSVVADRRPRRSINDGDAAFNQVLQRIFVRFSHNFQRFTALVREYRTRSSIGTNSALNVSPTSLNCHNPSPNGTAIKRGKLCSRPAIKLKKMITSLFGSKEPQKPGDSGDEPKLGLFDRMRQAVSRTRESFSAKISDLAALTRTVDESALDNLESILLSSDLGVPTTTAILDALRDRARHQAIEGGAELRDLFKAQLIAILSAPQGAAAAQQVPAPKITFLVGVNGTGKTTSSGKLAAWSRAQGRSVLLCAADTFRAAAIEQLEVWASRSGVEMIKTRPGGDPAAVLYDAISAAKSRVH